MFENHINKKHSTEPEQSTREINVPSTVDEESHNTFAFQCPSKAEWCTCKGYKFQKHLQNHINKVHSPKSTFIEEPKKGKEKSKRKNPPKSQINKNPPKKKKKNPL